jgi:tetratricopeptide (TPR) repeat protein
MIDAQFFFETGSVYYITNILLHLATGCALFRLLLLLNDNREAAFILTIFYLVNPLFVHTVAWVPSRGDLLIGLFGILTMILFIKLANTPKIKYGIWAILSFAAALFSKETAILILFLAPVWLIFNNRGKELRKPLTLFTLGGFILVSALFFLLRARVVTPSVAAGQFGLGSLVHNLGVIPELTAKFFLPLRLSPMPEFLWFNIMAGVLILILGGVLVFREGGDRKQGAWGLTWFLLFSIPGMMYTHQFGSAAYDYLEHRAYLPIAGIIIMLFSLFTGSEKISNHKLMIAFIPLLLFYAVFSFIYAGNYKDPLSFFDRAAETNPHSAVARYNRGCLKAEVGDYQGALADYNQAVSIKPDYSVAYLNKGVALYQLNDKPGALSAYRMAVKHDSLLFQAQFNLASTLFELGDADESLKSYDRALELYPAYAPAYSRRGFIYFRKQDYPAALNDFSSALKYDPNDAFALVNRGRVRYISKDTMGACEDWKMANTLGNEEATALLSKYCR